MKYRRGGIAPAVALAGAVALSAVAQGSTLWGAERGAREFDILVDGVKIGTQTLDNNQSGEFFTVEYPIPAELTRGKWRVSVRFSAHPGKMAGGVFGCAVLRAATPEDTAALKG